MSDEITVTNPAATYINTFLKSLSEQAGFKIAVKKSGCSGYAYVADVASEPKDTDICMRQNGIQLFIDSDSLPILRGTVIDIVEKGLGQKQLCFNNPNVKDTCGCGESFTVGESHLDENQE